MVAGSIFNDQTPARYKCGENAYWEYDPVTKTLTIDGSGSTYEYDYYTDTPWDDLPVTKLVIGKDITGLNAYHFGLYDLQTVIIPEYSRLEYVRMGLFRTFDAKDIYYGGTERQWNAKR